MVTGAHVLADASSLGALPTERFGIAPKAGTEPATPAFQPKNAWRGSASSWSRSALCMAAGAANPSSLPQSILRRKPTGGLNRTDNSTRFDGI